MGNILKGQAIYHPQISNYLVITNNENKVIDLNTLLSENKGNLTHQVLENYNYCYRGTKYSYSQLGENKAFNLEIANYFSNSNTLTKELMGCFDVKDRFIVRLTETLERYINKARYETILAANKLSVDYLNSELDYHGYEFYYRQRCYNAENAIYSYYSSFEILMQIIWIYRGFHGNEYNFKKALKSYRTPNGLIKKLLDEIDLDFVKLIKSDDKNNNIRKEFSKVKGWCNKFKHRGILEFDGFMYEDKPTSKVIFTEEYKQNTGVKDHSSANSKYEYIDLDNDVIPALIEYHKNLCVLSNDVLKKVGMPV